MALKTALTEQKAKKKSRKQSFKQDRTEERKNTNQKGRTTSLKEMIGKVFWF